MWTKRYEDMNRAVPRAGAGKRVAAYCRVSTDREDQAGSFESQQRFFLEYIAGHPGWELVEIFADEGATGTSTRGRKAFNRMIDRARAGEIDLILTKEISRFARNTLDSIYYTRELRRLGVGVLFLNDGINTLDGDGELRLSILASIAQEESRRTSQRVKWGQKRRMEQGVVFGRGLLGYELQDGALAVEETGAGVVRMIFRKLTEEEKGVRVIARELNEAGILTGEGNLWQAAGVLRVLRNEKYCGDLVQKKTYTPDYLTHARKVNRGQEEFVILRDHHAAIIPRELFEEANRLLDVRSTQSQGKGKYSGRHPFSGKIRCGLCGSMYAARFRTRADGKQYRAWRCLQGVKYGLAGCPAGSLRDETVAEIVEKVCGGLGLEKLDVEELLRLVGAEVGTERLAGLRQAGERACQELPEAFTARLVEQIVVTERQAEVRIKGLPYRWSFEI